MATYEVPPWAADGERPPLAVRPLHLALAAFVATVPPFSPLFASLAAAPQYAAVEASFLFAFLVAAVLASIAVIVRALQARPRPWRRSRVTAVCVVAYLVGLGVFEALVFAGQPMPALALAAGIVAGAALPVLAAEWARAVEGPMASSLALCAFVAVLACFGSWMLALLPVEGVALAYGICALVGAAPVAVTARAGAPAVPVRRARQAVERLLSVTWLPLLGIAVFAFMVTVIAHSAFGVARASLVGGMLAALVVFAACFLWGKRPLLPWCYRVLVPVMAAVFVVLGSFPAGTFPKDASVVALYVFYIVLALIGCALLLAVVRARELPPNATVGLGVAVATAAALAGFVLSEVLAVTDDFGPWATVLTGAFVSVLLVFLGKTAWAELVSVPEDGAAPEEGAGAGERAGATPEAVAAEDLWTESTVQDALEARCAALAARFDLSPREAEILVFLARGFSPAYIAKELVLSVSTVRTHVRNIYRKLGIGKREELIHLVDGA
ncbi:helix-turn-helix transcriptional regulator [uncultured Adlercreutzia sp.]|uniref:response regulator transcription factor n=1 Tax=uncultured Adlercreutzia sp. TaxID=875803 RepID=UPI0025D2B2F7|nr:helix-turn-helix transcriptional regulator [uncultured Adlercreutzia sp.]